jgi:ATP-binding protein involved in chromosome partitioning
MTDDRVREARRVVENYVEPCLGMPLSEAKAVTSVRSEGGSTLVEVELGFPARRYGPELAAGLERLLAAQPGVGPARVSVDWRVAPQAVQGGLKPLPGIANVVAVASGKGGVGKSTVAANLALALARQGARVGLLDADVYGPSQPRMMGLAGQRPSAPDGKTLEPPVSHGVKVMSIGFLVDEEQPMVWRGPMVSQALTQLLTGTRLGRAGLPDHRHATGHRRHPAHANAARARVSGAVIVTTPQDIALLDARKGLMMFRKVEVPVLGIVENMSVHVCPECGHASHIFGAGGGREMAARYGVELLGELPLELAIREQADGGCPTVAAAPDSSAGIAYQAIARRAAAALARVATGGAAAFPKITIEDEE